MNFLKFFQNLKRAIRKRMCGLINSILLTNRNRNTYHECHEFAPSQPGVSRAFRNYFYPPAFEFLFVNNIYHVYVVWRPCPLKTSTKVLLSPNLHSHLQLYKVSDMRCSFSYLFQSRLRLQPLPKPSLEDIVFLDGFQLKTQNMPFKSIIVH